MAISNIGSGTSAYINQSVQALKNQLTVLQSQITTGEKSTTYAGMGVNEGFAIAARSQLANIAAFTDTQTQVNTNIGVANTALQSLVNIGNTVQNSANSASPTLDSSGQSVAQQTSATQLASLLGILNTQSGNNYLFSGSAINTPSVASYDSIINGTTTQAGLKQLIAQRAQADLGTTTIGANGLSGAVITQPTTNSVQIATNGPGSLFAFTLTGISSTGSSATVTGPTGTPAAISVTLNSDPISGDQFNFSFNLPDGTSENVQLTATGSSSPPAGSFTIGATAAATASNLSAALTTAIGALPVSTGRVSITSLSSTSLQVNGDTTPFGLKLSAVSATGTAVTTSGPTGSPAAGTVALNPVVVTGSAVNDQANLAPIGSATTLSGTGNALSSSFAAGDSLTVDGTTYTFVNTGSPTGTSGNNIDISDSVGTLLSKIDAAAGISSSINGGTGAITLNTVNATQNLSITSNNHAALAALGFPPTVTATLAQPSSGDQVSFSFTLPDGTTQQIALTATTTNPPPAGSYLIGSSTAATTSNLKTALAASVWNLANTSLVASSAVEAGNDFFSAGVATGNAVNNQAATPVAISASTKLSGSAGTNSLTSGFAAGDTLTVNGTTYTFVNTGSTAGTTGDNIDISDTLGTLLSKIDSVTGTSTPSTISASGAITLHTDDAPDLKITSSNTAALAALGFGSTVSGTLAPLRVAGPPYNTATSLVSGTSANTVSWYTGNQGAAGSARASATARIDNSVTVQYGMQADEQAIRTQLQNLAVLSAVTTSPTNPVGTQVVAALSQDVAKNLSAQPGQQSIEDIQADLSNAQVTIQDAQSRQTQSQSTLQNLISQTETVSTDQVASEILALQTDLSASYQTTSMLSQLTLTKYLPVG
jgi:hypothetical protein